MRDSSLRLFALRTQICILLTACRKSSGSV
jgi:hypothetical protein